MVLHQILHEAERATENKPPSIPLGRWGSPASGGWGVGGGGTGPAFMVIGSSSGRGRRLVLRTPDTSHPPIAGFVPKQPQVIALIGQANEAII